MKIPDTLHIDGKNIPSADGNRIPCFDPSTGESIAGIPRGSADDVNRAVESSVAAWHFEWSRWLPGRRAEVLREIGREVKLHSEELAVLDSLSMGRPLQFAREDVLGAVETIFYNAGAADKMEGRSAPLDGDTIDFTVREPLGPTAHIIPWNFPFGMLIRSAAPALASGCTVIAKPSEISSFSALRFAEIAEEAGLPPGVLNVVTGYGDEAGAALVSHPEIRGITFTGSRETGSSVMRAAAEHVTPLMLELGGKNAFIVFPDCDLEDTVEQALKAAFENSGQVCSAASRFILHKGIADSFINLLKERTASLTIGPAMDSPDMGPLASAEQYKKLRNYLEGNSEELNRQILGGVRKHIGGSRGGFGADRGKDLPESGFFIEPTAFEIIDLSSRLWRDEIFGPLIGVVRFSDEGEAVRLANDTGYGPNAGIFTSDISRALRLSTRIRTGSLWINGWSLGGPRAPVGGVKAIGPGKQRRMAGLLNYTVEKNIAVRI